MCIMMTSCVWDPPSYHFDYDEMIETVVSIELVKYDNNDTDSVIVKPDTKLKFDLSKIISSQVLEESKTNVFLFDLSKIGFLIYDTSTEEPIDECLKINLENKDFIIICCVDTSDGREGAMVAKFNEKSEFIEHIASCGYSSWYGPMIEQYFG